MSNVYPHATRMSVVVKKIADAGKLAADLAPFELGVLNNKTWKSVDDTSIPSVEEIRFAVGSPNVGQKGIGAKGFPNLYSHQESMKSQAWFSINDWYSDTPKDLKPFIGYFGYNGFNDCLVEKHECGKTYAYRVAAYGEIVERVYGQWRVEEEFSVNTPCCGECQSASCKTADVGASYEELVKKINESQKISRFGFATLLRSCETDATPAATFLDAFEFTLTLCDKGDNEALSNVMAQYPGLDIYRSRRVGSKSTYKVCDETKPEDFVLHPGSFPKQGCAACEAPYTTETPSTLTTGAEEGQFTSEVSDRSTIDIDCVETAQPDVAWVKGEAKKLAKRKLEAIFKIDDCNSAAIQDLIDAQYKNEDGDFLFNILSIEKELLDCVGKITVEQKSKTCLAKDCDTDDVNSYFVKIPDFLGNILTDIACDDTAEPGVDCKAGVKLTSYVPDEVADFCGKDPYDFVETNVAQFEMYEVQTTEFPDATCNKMPVPFWVAQKGTYKTLAGHQVLKEILAYRKYRSEWFTNPSMANASYYNKAEGIVYGVDPSKRYYVVNLIGNYSEVTSLSSSFGDKMETLALYFENLETRDEFIELMKKSKFLANKALRFDI